MKSISARLSFIIILFIPYMSVHAQKVFDFDATCQRAYHEIICLKLNSGQQIINLARQQNPNNLIPELLESYIDFYELFFNEDPAEYKNRKDDFDKYLDKLEEGPDSSPFYNYTRATVLLQKACVQIKFGSMFSAGWNFRKAFGLIKDNRKDFPSFEPNNMIYGPAMVAAGIIPDGYKMLASIFGVKGSVKEGVAIMQAFVNSDDPLAKIYFEEASFYYCYIIFYIENKPEEAFQYITEHNLDVVNNHLLAYMAANLAINNKENEFAKKVILGRNQSPEYMKTAIWDFEMGYIKMRHLETEEAIKYFTSYLDNFKGKFYVKDACEKLSWCYYLMGNNAAAQSAMKRVTEIGNTATDADKQANRDAKSGVFPNILLLKARVLSDGGYNTEALRVLAGKSSNDFSSPEDKLEFVYRLGRIYDDMNNFDSAIKAYNITINIGKNRTEYYAARAALQVGLIYEKLGKKDAAIAYYQKCLNMDDHEYKDSIDQKAKAGIARCKGQ
ncbi:MAG TPA: tetratricopeptide repeat protein [Chitinophagaceae bacterium]|nr:tetratricopeptide repeat protein [Chitinophagaceae bacterium]